MASCGRNRQLRCGAKEVKRGREKASNRPGGVAPRKMRDERRCADSEADREDVKAAPDDCTSSFRRNVLRHATECQSSDERICHDRTDKKEERRNGARNSARVREHCSARPDRERVAVRAGAHGDGRTKSRSVAGLTQHAPGFAGLVRDPPTDRASAEARHTAPRVAATVIHAEDGLAKGYEALASGDWLGAREAFESALSASESPEALDGLGRALWWLREERDAVVYRERAYAGFRRDGELARASRIALWLSREYALAFGNDAVASGWRIPASSASQRTRAPRAG